MHSCQVDDLDLLILGGYYNESLRRGGAISSLLLGLIDNGDVSSEFGTDIYVIYDIFR